MKSSSLIRLGDVGQNHVFQTPVILIGHPHVTEEEHLMCWNNESSTRREEFHMSRRVKFLHNISKLEVFLTHTDIGFFEYFSFLRLTGSEKNPLHLMCSYVEL